MGWMIRDLSAALYSFAAPSNLRSLGGPPQMGLTFLLIQIRFPIP